MKRPASPPFPMTATVPAGLEEVLAGELRTLGASQIRMGRGAVEYTGDRALLYRSNLSLRTAMRVLMPLKEFQARDDSSFYRQLRSFPFEEWMDLNHTFLVDAAVRSETFRHSGHVALRVKDALADRFREKRGRRPDVDLKRPDVRFHIHIREEECLLSLDSSGESLHKRGYRFRQTEAPLKESLAAGLVLLSGWNGETVLVDPMCGSGTILLEAALVALNRSPGIYRREFAFMNWKNYDEALFQRVREEAVKAEREWKGLLYGSDSSSSALRAARESAQEAGLEDLIRFEKLPFESREAPEGGPGTVILNPPYGHRLELENAEEFYRSLGRRLKEAYAGYEAFVFSSNLEGLKKIGLKPARKYVLYNGPLECRFNRYPLQG